MATSGEPRKFNQNGIPVSVQNEYDSSTIEFAGMVDTVWQ